MTSLLHTEHDAVVAELLPWGARMITTDGLEVLVDQTKRGPVELAVGSHARVVILDDQRDPLRASCLTLDFDIARRLRNT